MPFNRILLIVFIAWFITQTIKLIVFRVINKKFVLERFFGDGGMPSSHSAVVASLATAIGLQSGWDSPLFAVATVLAVIVMHDATGVRQETGKQAKVINDLVKLVQAKDRGEMTPAETLKEFVGHTGPQVFVGMLCGILVALIMNIILPG
ncbi:MAG: divergent PAP2 family protein [Clostridia bacterium]